LGRGDEPSPIKQGDQVLKNVAQKGGTEWGGKNSFFRTVLQDNLGRNPRGRSKLLQGEVRDLSIVRGLVKWIRCS